MIELASEVRATVEEAAARLRALSEVEVLRGRGAGRWVKKEILGHLIDSALNNHQGFVGAQLDRPYAHPGYDQDAWVALHRYRERPWLELVEAWIALNRQVASVIELVPDTELGTSCRFGAREPTSLEWWMRDYLRHLRHHLAQILG